MERVTNFNNTKVGDEFVWLGKRYLASGFAQIVKCEKVTPKRVLIGGWYYEKSTANPINGAPRAYQLSDVLREEITNHNMRSAISQIKPERLTIDQVRRIFNIIKE